MTFHQNEIQALGTVNQIERKERMGKIEEE